MVPEAVETADWAVEVAVETADCAVELAVDTPDWAVDVAVVVTPETETGGVGTETVGGLGTEGVVTDGVESLGRPEARLAGAPDPPRAASAPARRPIRISDFARFINELTELTGGDPRTFNAPESRNFQIKGAPDANLADPHSHHVPGWRSLDRADGPPVQETRQVCGASVSARIHGTGQLGGGGGPWRMTPRSRSTAAIRSTGTRGPSGGG